MILEEFESLDNDESAESRDSKSFQYGFKPHKEYKMEEGFKKKIEENINKAKVYASRVSDEVAIFVPIDSETIAEFTLKNILKVKKEGQKEISANVEFPFPLYNTLFSSYSKKYKEKIKHALGIFLDDGEEYLFGGMMSNLNKKHPVLFSEILFDDLMSEDTTEEEKKAISWWVSRNTQQISLSMKLKFMEALYPLGGDFTSDAIEIADTMLPELDFLPILEKIRVFCINKEDKANLIYAEAVIKQIKEGLESEQPSYFYSAFRGQCLSSDWLRQTIDRRFDSFKGYPQRRNLYLSHSFISFLFLLDCQPMIP